MEKEYELFNIILYCVLYVLIALEFTYQKIMLVLVIGNTYINLYLLRHRVYYLYITLRLTFLSRR